MPEQRVTTHQRQQVAERARGCCEYCLSQAQFSPNPFSIEHIHPRSAGGATQLDNLALSCAGCNAHKYNKTQALDPISNKLVALFHPRTQHWTEHFTWNETYTLVLGLTPTGRATVETLQLNRVTLQNLRAVLYTAGLHPPE
ncbi:HNH endonuclease signature motif containing protein [uncultured Thiothrix sp.]|uniref:HNH endonuclease signature motif containing protein n=1 Tax=uncultured Thiothrix sp. TaxID=223185 RepID=UPI002610D6A3|nr:HNH endonuclease signature motif containing protein [uncultured Thiothrix sp.]